MYIYMVYTPPAPDDSTIQLRLYLRREDHMITINLFATSPAPDDSTLQIRLPVPAPLRFRSSAVS